METAAAVLPVPSRTHGLARRASWSLAIVHVLVAISYLFFTPSRPAGSGSLSLVLLIDSSLPVWPATFAASAALVAAGLVTGRLRLLIAGHAIAAVVTLWYGAAAVIGAIWSDPMSASPSGVMILGLSAAHWIGGLMWRETANRAGATK